MNNSVNAKITLYIIMIPSFLKKKSGLIIQSMNVERNNNLDAKASCAVFPFSLDCIVSL